MRTTGSGSGCSEYLQARGSSRRPITAADMDAIRAMPGDAYLVDGEYGLIDLTLHYKASSHFGAYLTIPYFFFGGGGLDQPPEETSAALSSSSPARARSSSLW